MSDDHLRYPIGPCIAPAANSLAARRVLIEQIAAAPQQLAEAVKTLGADQLDRPYRPGGWTARQVVHHTADSHLNAYVRMRLAVTEDRPTVKPYDENRWAELPDYRLPAELSLDLLRSLHGRWVVMLRSLPESDFARVFNHPDNGPTTLDAALAYYAWHGRQHAAHVALCVVSQGKS